MGWNWSLALIVVTTLLGCSGGGSLANVDVGTALGAAADIGRAKAMRTALAAAVFARQPPPAAEVRRAFLPRPSSAAWPRRC
jgi:hypothetical protein